MSRGAAEGQNGPHAQTSAELISLNDLAGSPESSLKGSAFSYLDAMALPHMLQCPGQRCLDFHVGEEAEGSPWLWMSSKRSKSEWAARALVGEICHNIRLHGRASIRTVGRDVRQRGHTFQMNAAYHAIRLMASPLSQGGSPLSLHSSLLHILHRQSLHGTLVQDPADAPMKHPPAEGARRLPGDTAKKARIVVLSSPSIGT